MNLHMKKAFIFFFLAGITLAACNSQDSGEKTSTATTQTQDTSKETLETESSTTPEIDVDAISADINGYRQMIEDKLESLDRREMDTASARDQIKQKWSVIHYYFDNGHVVRVKTYPHEGQSNRTEEFYYRGGELVCAVVEDNGTQQGKEESIQGKVYYYYNGKAIREVNNTDEQEYSIRESDAERLMQEAKEYFELTPTSEM